LFATFKVGGAATFPNLIAILSGLNETYVYKNFDLQKNGEIEKVPLIWNDFNRNSFVTALAEDQCWIETFEYCKRGFEKQPTNFHLRPATVAAEKNLNVTKKEGMVYCLGYQHYLDFISQYLLDFATQFEKDKFL
jgi:hypothetical protein